MNSLTPNPLPSCPIDIYFFPFSFPLSNEFKSNTIFIIWNTNKWNPSNAYTIYTQFCICYSAQFTSHAHMEAHSRWAFDSASCVMTFQHFNCHRLTCVCCMLYVNGTHHVLRLISLKEHFKFFGNETKLTWKSPPQISKIHPIWRITNYMWELIPDR